MQNIHIKLDQIPMPQGINAALAAGENGNYTILLNSEAEPDQRAASFLHEVLHIYHQDANSDRDAAEIEEERHEEIKRLFQLMAM